MEKPDLTLTAPRKKRFAPTLKDFPLPVPIENLTGISASSSRWQYYTGHLEGDHVTVKHTGDMDYLNKMGFFGKGTLSRSQPEYNFGGKWDIQRDRRPGGKVLAYTTRRKYERRLMWRKQHKSQLGETDVEYDTDMEKIPVPLPKKLIVENKSVDDRAMNVDGQGHSEGEGPVINQGQKEIEGQSICENRNDDEKNFERGKVKDSWAMEAEITDPWVTGSKNADPWDTETETADPWDTGPKELDPWADAGTTSEAADFWGVESASNTNSDSKNDIRTSFNVKEIENDKIQEGSKGKSGIVSEGNKCDSDIQKCSNGSKSHCNSECRTSELSHSFSNANRKQNVMKSANNISRDCFQNASLSQEKVESRTRTSSEHDTKSENGSNLPNNGIKYEVCNEEINDCGQANVIDEDVEMTDKTNKGSSSEEKVKDISDKTENIESNNIISGLSEASEANIQDQEKAPNDPSETADQLQTTEDAPVDPKAPIDPACLSDHEDGTLLVGEDTDDSEVEEDLLRETRWLPAVKRNPFEIKEDLQLSLEETYFLSYGLGCLVVLDKADHPLDLLSLWTYSCQQNPRFLVRYIAYHHFRVKGWVVTNGLKYGADWMLYKEGPVYYHSTYSVIVRMIDESTMTETECNRSITWASLAGINRITEKVSKEVLLCYVIKPKNITEDELKSPKCISKFKIQEILLKRWVSNQERENKDYVLMP